MQRRVAVSVVVSCLTILVAACGGSGDAPADCSATGGCGHVADTIGPAGGTRTMPGGASVTIPPGALASEVLITVSASSVAGPAGAVTPVYQFGPAGTQFTHPVTVSFPVPAGTQGGSVAVYWTRPASTSDWDVLPTSVAGSVASTQVSHFSAGFVGASCALDQACAPTNACHVGTTTCNGTPACVDTGASVADGIACGDGLTCKAGTCAGPTCDPGLACTPSGSPDPCKTYLTSCDGSGGTICAPAGNAPDGTSCGGVDSCAAGVCQPPCPSATVKVPATGSPAWSAEFAAWLGANGYAHLAANQGWGGGTGCGSSTRVPVILVHGNATGSDPTSGLAGLRNSLLAGGYTACDLYAITWIEQNASASLNHHKASYLKLLRDFVDAVKGYTGSARVSVVAWSMGVTISRKAIQGGVAYSDPERTVGCGLGGSMAASVDTLLGVAGLNRGITMCAGATSPTCSENGFRIDSAFLRDINGGSGGDYSPARPAAHVYSFYLPDDQYVCGSNPRGLGPFPCEVFGTHTSIIQGGDFARGYDLFNEAHGNTMGLNFNCTPDAASLASNCDHVLAFNDSVTLDAMVRSIRDGATTSLPPPAFSTADVAGDWDLLEFSVGDQAGWVAASLSFDALGQGTYVTFTDSTGAAALPAGGVDLAVDENGVVTSPQAGAAVFHGRMNAAKDLIVASLGSSGTATDSRLAVFRKRILGVTYSGADVAGLSFGFHEIRSGGSTEWARGTGATDSIGTVTLGSMVLPSGPATPPADPGQLVVDAAGRVTIPSQPSFHGVMTPDKKAIFAVQTVGGATPTHAMTVILVGGQTFATSDLATAPWEFHGVNSGATSATSPWYYGNFISTAAGVVTFRYQRTPAGPSNFPSMTLAVSSDGTVSQGANASYAGTLDWGKALLVRTQTASGVSGFAISIR